MGTKRLEQDEFLRQLMKSEREILRYVMAIVPRIADAQEIVQETAVALWKNVDQYDPDRPFTPWACRFAANKAKEHLRKNNRWNGFLDENTATLLLARRQEISDELDQRMEPLRDCVNELPSHNRTLIQKYYFEQTDISQISQDVDRTAEAVYKALQRLRSGLMDCVNGKLSAAENSS